MLLHMVADMVVNEVADMLLHMVVDMAYPRLASVTTGGLTKTFGLGGYGPEENPSQAWKDGMRITSNGNLLVI